MMWRTIIIPFLPACLLALSALAACGPTASPDVHRAQPQPDAYAASYFAGTDEIIGPDGPVAATFVDAEYEQLRRPDAIAPVYDPRFLSASEADLPAGELVIGLTVNGDSRAYPAGILYHREMVNDTVGGVPTLITWCPLCYTALVHRRSVGDTTLIFGNQGALYKGAMTWYDHGAGSIWSQPTGEAIAGPLAGAQLTLIPSQLTTWSQWRAAHPDTRVLTTATPSQPYRGRQPGEQHVVGVVIGDQAAAWPYPAVVQRGRIDATVGDTPVRLWQDDATGAIRATTADGSPRELPAIIAYRWAWEKLYPADSLR